MIVVAKKPDPEKENSMKFEVNEAMLSAIRIILQKTNFEGGARDIDGFPGCRVYVTNGAPLKEANSYPLSSELFPGLPGNKKVFLVL